MLSIECIGPSGIGKSTFCRVLADRIPISNLKKRRWLLLDEALKEAGFMPDPTLTQRIKMKMKPPSLPPPSELFRRYSDELSSILAVFERGVRKTDPEPWQKIHISGYFFQNILYRSLLVHHIFENRKVILLDEGIVHNGGYHIYDGSGLTNRFSRDNLLSSVIFPSAVVHFTLLEGEYRKRIDTRFRESASRDLNRIRSDVDKSDIDDLIRKEREEAGKKAETCRSLGIPVLEINCDPTEKNMNKVLKLIDDVSE